MSLCWRSFISLHDRPAGLSKDAQSIAGSIIPAVAASLETTA